MAYRTRVNDPMAASIKSYGVRSRHLSSPWRRQTDYAAALFLYVKGVCSRVGPLPRGFKRCVSFTLKVCVHASVRYREALNVAFLGN